MLERFSSKIWSGLWLQALGCTDLVINPKLSVRACEQWTVDKIPSFLGEDLCLSYSLWAASKLRWKQLQAIELGNCVHHIRELHMHIKKVKTLARFLMRTRFAFQVFCLSLSSMSMAGATILANSMHDSKKGILHIPAVWRDQTHSAEVPTNLSCHRQYLRSPPLSCSTPAVKRHNGLRLIAPRFLVLLDLQLSL